MSNVEALRRSIRQAIGDEQQVFVDMSEVAFIDSRGINLLSETAQNLSDAGRELVVVVPEDGLAAQLLKITGLDEVIPILPTLDDLS